MDSILEGFGVAFLVEFVRALPWPEAWKRRKPLACNACMVGWSLIALAAARGPEWHLLASGGVAYVVLKWLASIGEAVGPPLG